MKKRFLIVTFLIVSFITTSCNREFERAFKSTDPEVIINTARSMYEQEKWANAISLFEKSVPYFSGKKEAGEISYKSAMANYKDKNYRLAGTQFKQFHVNNLKDSLAEQALYLSAFCYYEGVPEYNLDQENTYSALKELQNFVDTYPNSNKVKEATQYIDELQHKLEKKAFKIAESYYKTLEFRAASIAFDNLLEDFPDTKYREEAMFYSLKAKHDWAVNSRLDRRRNYIKNVLTQHRLFVKAFPSSKYLKDANKLLKDLDEAEQEIIKWEKRINSQNKNT